MSERRKKRVPVLRWIILGIVVVLLILLGAIGWHFYDSLQPIQKDSEEVAFTVADGDTVSSVCAKLEQAGVIKDAKVSYYYARYKKLGNLIAGDYTIDKSWNTEQILTYLSDEKNTEQEFVTLTVIEGDWAKHIAQKASEITNVSYDDLINLWNNREWIESVMPEYPFLTDEIFSEDARIYLEGYLAPSTYYLDPKMSAEEITRKMLDETLVNYNEFKDRIDESDYTIHQIFTLASIVQYEGGGSEEDLRTIAGVFYNRLNIDMPLQSSVTVCYAIDYDKDNDTWQACEFNSDFDSPYNTYLHYGLPPGPIENPGKTVLNAVLNPIESDYYFFMADVYGDGTIYYARTLDEHNANVAKYLQQ